MPVAWPHKTVKTSYVESRGNLPGNGHVRLVVSQNGVDDVRRLVGGCSDGAEMVLPRTSPAFVVGP